MATRAHRYLQNAIIKEYTIPAGKTATEGMGVKFSGADDQVELSTAGDRSFGIAMESGVALDKIEVALLFHAVIPVKVGTGGATRGSEATMNTDGYIDRALGGGTTSREIAGVFLQTGVVGDIVGLGISQFSGVSS